MVDEPKKSTDETAIVKPEDSTEEAEAIDMLEGLPTQEKAQSQNFKNPIKKDMNVKYFNF